MLFEDTKFGYGGTVAHSWLVCGFIDTQVRRYEDSQRCLPMHQTACFWNCCPTGTIQKKTFPHVIKKCVYGICVLCVILLDGISPPPPPHVVSGQIQPYSTHSKQSVAFWTKSPKHHHNTNKEHRPEDLFFQIAAHNEAGGPAHGQCSDLCLSKPWDNCVTYYKETVPVRDRGGVGFLSQDFLGIVKN